MQNSLFDFPQIQIDKPIRLIELFGGIGSQAMALRNIGADFEHYRLVEFDKYAVASYNAIHGTDFETTDICDVHGADLGIVEKDKYCYILTYSFPCTDLSVAGLMKGMSKSDWEAGHSTHSGLLWEVERILGELQKQDLPQVLLMENVPQVHAEQNKADFENWLSFLRKKGYQNFYQDLNARDYGIPQNRERCFCVSVLADDFIDFEFPNQIPLKTVMKDYLEENVDDKYYINNEKADKLIQQLLKNGTIGTETINTNGKDFVEKTDVATTLCARISKGFSESFQAMSGVCEQRTENREQRTENREQRTENREQRTENREQRTENREQRIMRTIDLCVKNPREITVANCIKARYDCGISNLQADGSGVVEYTENRKNN
ncbi:MAG: DNA (cytosine-5-)-methyltransferase [Treponema sp.]|uniref:DNA (cytosine-5-)-methyltransferase n=1 Tax=Treponema sp. TaxID=166 RepID=UPI0025E9D10D|nr:DNA (cytosine-5-)-methyltransferase [Treponema sp.]MBQ8680846.1 DNA (cytosine-5-)-methyltransferase [Treponema sp.]MBR1637920.1 DNA (cytosine-5-)-methyltransferase [Treponema sp.]